MTEPPAAPPPPTDGSEPAAIELAAAADVLGVADPPPPELLPNPYDPLPTKPVAVVATALDLLTRTSGSLRRASFYIGLITLGLAAPAALLVWRITADVSTFTTREVAALAFSGLEGYLNAALLLALLGLFVATIESRAIAVVLLASRLGNEPAGLQDAVQRTRAVFWRLLWGLGLAGIPLRLAQSFLQDRFAGLFGIESEATVISASIVAAVLFSPFAFLVTGIVLGDLGPIQSLRQSIRLFGRSKLTAVVVALFEFGSQLLTIAGVLAALDLVLRLVDVLQLGSTQDTLATAGIAALIVVLVFAGGTLLFTVSAISIAPQVVAFLALTRSAPGLRRLRGDDRPFRWITRPMWAGIVAGALAVAAGLAALAR